MGGQIFLLKSELNCTVFQIDIPVILSWGKPGEDGCSVDTLGSNIYADLNRSQHVGYGEDLACVQLNNMYNNQKSFNAG